METITKKAIEGGWNEGVDPRMYGNWETYKYEAVCDPLFWQVFGKACGWGITKDDYGKTPQKKKEMEWKYRALQFHEINLTEGWNKAVEYLNNLIK